MTWKSQTEPPKAGQKSESGDTFTGHTYFCPECGKEIYGYIDYVWKTPKGRLYKGDRPDEDSDEDEDEYIPKEYAGCINCVNSWEVKELKEKVRFVFR